MTSSSSWLTPSSRRRRAAYQPADEITAWRERDPIPRAARRLRELGVSQEEVDAIERSAEDEVKRTFAAVEAAPTATWPETLRAKVQAAQRQGEGR